MRLFHILRKELLVLALLLSVSHGFAKCVIVTSPGEPALGNGDVLFKLLTSQTKCPANVFALHTLLTAKGYDIKKSLVSNRGFHSRSDSFSLFEWVIGSGPAGVSQPGDFFLGHFTASDEQTLIADQNTDQESLMIELELKDPSKNGAYNFYELRGTGEGSQWFYRGDSFDIYADLKLLHRNAPDEEIFGSRLRCSGCHLSGGPILKELAAPHNDWWTKLRPIDLTGWTFEKALGEMLSLNADDASKRLPSAVSDAEELAQLVTASSNQLIHSPQINAKRTTSLTLAERLRPLFCPMELNLESSSRPVDDGGDIDIPSGFFVDPRLATASVSMPRQAYLDALTQLGSQFPESNPVRPDGDHAWVTPVKSHYDQEAVTELVQQGLISNHFVRAVLAVDFTNPVFSNARCQLLRLVPSETADWQSQFRLALAKSSSPSGAQLAAGLSQPGDQSQAKAKAFSEACKARYLKADEAKALVTLLFQRRAEAFASDISKNELGQILEPSFRVIFPKIEQVPNLARPLSLDPDSCAVVGGE